VGRSDSPGTMATDVRRGLVMPVLALPFDPIGRPWVVLELASPPMRLQGHAGSHPWKPLDHEEDASQEGRAAVDGGSSDMNVLEAIPFGTGIGRAVREPNGRVRAHIPGGRFLRPKCPQSRG
jgi:hypothetical protein